MAEPIPSWAIAGATGAVEAATVRAAVSGSCRAPAAARSSSTRVSSSRCVVCSTSGTRATGFSVATGTCLSNKDVYVSISQARRFALRRGDYVEGACRPAGNTEKFPALLRIDTVSGLDPEEARKRPRFEDLTPLFPDERLHLEMPGEKENMTARIVDLLSPDRQGSAWADRVAAQGGQDHGDEAHRSLHRGEQPGRAPDGAAGGRTS